MIFKRFTRSFCALILTFSAANLWAESEKIAHFYPAETNGHKVPIMTAHEVSFDLPQGVPAGKKVKLDFLARIDYPILGGSPGYGLVVIANEKPLPSRLLMNIPDRMRLFYGSTAPGDDIYLPYRFQQHHGEGKYFEQLCKTGAFSLNIVYAPDFKNIDEPVHKYRTPGFSRKHFIFDVTEFCRPGKNTLAFVNHLPKWIIGRLGNRSQLPIVIQDVKVTVTDEKMVRPLPFWMAELEEAGNRMDWYSPRKEWKTNYTWSVTNDGTLFVKSAGNTYKITSSFTYPGGKNGFPSPRACDPKWKVVRTKIAGDAIKLTAAGSRYSIRRDFIPRPTCLEIRDTITNLTNEIQPIIVRHHTPMQADADEAYLGGLKGDANEFYSSPAWMKENPTGYSGAANKTGLGFAAYDDVFRIHAEYLVSNRSLELSDKQLALAPGKTIVMIWQIYPVENGGYVTFINNIRQNWGLNTTEADFYGDNKGFNKPLPANWKKVEWPTEADREFHWCIVDNYMAKKGPSWGLKQWSDKELHQHQLATMKSIRAGFPKVEIIGGVAAMYFSNAGAEDLQRFGDSVMVRKNGTYPTEDGARFFIPTLSNDFGRMVEANVHRYLDMGFDGVYFDYMEGSRGEHRFTYNQYDGVSGDIDIRTGKLAAKKGSYQLLSQEFLQHLCRQIVARGKKVYGNVGNSTTSNMHALISLSPMRYTEAIDMDLLKRGQLYPCPNAMCRSPENMHLQVLLALREGMVATPFGLKYDHQGDNPWKAMWPIAYREMREGAVIGKDKIVTAISGYFGFGDKSEFTYRFFDKKGVPGQRNFSVVEKDGATFLEVKIEVGEVVVIERKKSQTK